MGRPVTRTIAALAVAMLALSACGSEREQADESTPTTVQRTTTTTTPTGPPPALTLADFGTFDRPTALAQREGSDDWYVALQGGRVALFRNGTVQERPVLDLSTQVGTQTGEGLLGLTFSPSGETFYVFFTDINANIRVNEYQLGEDGTANLGTQREILRIDKAATDHNGGQLAFHDGNLFIGIGDGSKAANDPDRNAQNLTTLLGKILRINPTPTSAQAYTIPFDNPYTQQSGARGEVWSYGLRDPHSFSFDSSGGLWVTDSGTITEEVNYVPRDRTGGKNFGWPNIEGSAPATGTTSTTNSATVGMGVEPVYEYKHTDNACKASGGAVYRGELIPDLLGRYLFGDNCTGQITALTLRGTEWEADRLSIDLPGLVGFATDHDGEMVAISNAGRVGVITAA